MLMKYTRKQEKMRKLLLLFLLCMVLQAMHAEEITLFGSDGAPVAYIDTGDGDIPIYMWDGLPVAYLTAAKDDDYNIYGFNGKHLGWFSKGIIMDHDGYAVGFIRGVINIYTKYEPYKSYKKYKPYKNYKEYAPCKPYYRRTFSEMPLSLFLIRGKKD